MEKIAIIPARGNSKGVPRKNLFPVAGKPLLHYTLEAVQSSGVFDRVIVSSNDQEILDYAVDFGATPDLRPRELAEDDVHSVHVIMEYIRRSQLSSETVISMLLATSPLRTVEHLRESMAAFLTADADSLVSVYESTKHLSNLRYVNGQGFMFPAVDVPVNVQRQEMPIMYVVNGSIYISTVESLLVYESFHRGNVLPYVMPEERSVDVNSLADIAKLEALGLL